MDFKDILESRKKHAEFNEQAWQNDGVNGNADFSASLWDPMKNATYAKRLLDEAIKPFSAKENHKDAVEEEDDDHYGDESHEAYESEAADAEQIMHALDQLQAEEQPQTGELPLVAGDWQAIYDETYSAYYFFNTVTEESLWEPPAEMIAAGWAAPATAEGGDETAATAEYYAQEQQPAYQATAPPAAVPGGANINQSGVQEAQIGGLSMENRSSLKSHLKELFFWTLQQYSAGQEIVKVGSNGKKYVRTIRLMGRFLVLSSKSVPKSVHVSKIEEIHLGMGGPDFKRLVKSIPEKKKDALMPQDNCCCSMTVGERDISLIFPSLETRDAFVFMIRILRRQAANAATSAVRG